MTVGRARVVREFEPFHFLKRSDGWAGTGLGEGPGVAAIREKELGLGLRLGLRVGGLRTKGFYLGVS